MPTKQPKAPVSSARSDDLAKPFQQYGCGPVQFAPTDEALYESHLLLFDDVASRPAGSMCRHLGPDVAQAATEPDALQKFSIREAARIVEGLSTPVAWVYWLDLLVTAVVAHGSTVAMLFAPLPLWGRAVLFVTALLGVYRGAMFNHELAHLSRKGFGAFRLAWNILFGIPFLMPSFLYDEHHAHHGHHTYGAERDAEYLPLAGRPREILLYLLQPFYYPILYFLRFLVVFPLSLLHPRLRQWVLERASTMAIVLDYRRDLPPAAERWWWFWEEFACSAFAWMFSWQIVMEWPWHVLPTVYLLSVCALLMNAVRTLAAHRFRRHRAKTSYVEQLLDSVNIPGHPVTELWAPVGLRYHALHHLFPAIPYHALGTAHRRLMAQLPADSLYRQTVSPGLWRTLVTLWNDAGSADARHAPQCPPATLSISTAHVVFRGIATKRRRRA